MNNNLMDLIFDTLPFPMWIKNEDGVFLKINKKFKNTFIDRELTQDDIIGKINKDIFEEDLAKEYDENHKKVVELKQPMVFEGKTRNKSVMSYLTPILDENENIIVITGVIKDTTETKNYQQSLINQNTLLETIINTIPDIIFYKDKQSRYLGGNKAFFKGFFGKKKSEVIGKNDFELHQDKEVAKAFIERDQEILKNKEDKYTEINILNKDDKILYLESVKTPLINEKGEAWGIVGVARDMTKRKELEDMLTQMSYTDKLTGLYNRAYFEEQINKLDDNEYYPLTLIMGDLNGLKAVNDNLGHLEGDKLLVEIAKVLKGSCRKEDLVFRWGGDEFIILLPNSDYKLGKEICNRIQLNCKNTDKTPIPLSISLGVSTKINKQKDIDEILKEAEDMMYIEKLKTKIN
ncbi:sensor domain-containing diguanylate cyclase [Paraclostridium sordellii]|uniref:Sensory box-containing diguanylate cyclase n=1 Tax=Paraclostridium sordellii TaxID=1505 RepID=A0A0C7QPV9_PARSO|nr:sensor domain-containing diguanylate cyclase [Paeniclostridium sordellii]CEN78576.1 sensory box-containing diguanylate cyclase [[Clostridium] sordellii] [Paeniclostridium sordellii]CEO08977.1 sensory box-containing diguanylate cyclase [[Clostridium] sordellii] [Paeniclostridium sordellii]CEP87401.1 sensory box-containing diguanylate cyclase [[Clostridium] sordellii] [Paeniclostridium sordellii]CEP98918.1 sensory box-containing diguanylate cyclase [[Clostridium] sordellii] [Paeniclostridium s